jgi:hypothetical protein
MQVRMHSGSQQQSHSYGRNANRRNVRTRRRTERRRLSLTLHQLCSIIPVTTQQRFPSHIWYLLNYFTTSGRNSFIPICAIIQTRVAINSTIVVNILSQTSTQIRELQSTSVNSSNDQRVALEPVGDSANKATKRHTLTSGYVHRYPFSTSTGISRGLSQDSWVLLIYESNSFSQLGLYQHHPQKQSNSSRATAHPSITVKLKTTTDDSWISHP